MIITDIQRIRGHQVQLSFDGAPDVQIDLRVWEESSLKAGSSLSEEGLEALLARSRQTRAREKALYLLSKRDYSKKELTDRLCREKGRFQSDRTEAAAAVAGRMEELGLVNDEAYAARLARDFGIPVLPVALVGTREMMPKKRGLPSCTVSIPAAGPSRNCAERESGGNWRKRR